MAHANTDIENTHSDSNVGVGSLSAFHAGNIHEHRLQGYVNMDMTQSTPLDGFYPNPVPSQFKNPLSLAPLKPRRGGKAKSKTGLRQRRATQHGSVN